LHLFALLCGGYPPRDCQAGKQYPEDPFLARLGCGPNSQPGGPNAATYSLYGNIADLNKAFNIYGSAIPCPGTTDPGPVAWQGGRVKCGHDFYPHTSLSMLTWTRDADLGDQRDSICRPRLLARLLDVRVISRIGEPHYGQP
jgi:hypothetical protein